METATSNELGEPHPAAALHSPTAAHGGDADGAARAHRLPADPLVVIRPSHSWSALNLGELWAYRELLYYLTWRDVKVRYKQTALGVAWVVLQPLMMTVVFTVILGVLARVPTGGVPYPLLVYVGLLPWTFFSSSVSAAGASLVGNSHLITKVYFPRPLVPLAAVAGRLVDLSISFVILAGMMLFYRVVPTWSLLWLPALVLLATLLALGVGTLLASLNVRYRDIGILLPVVVQLWMYLSPVIYPSELVPPAWRRLYALNPMVGIIEGFRAALFGGTLDRFALAVSVSAAAVVLTFSLYLFRRVERGFADVI